MRLIFKKEEIKNDEKRGGWKTDEGRLGSETVRCGYFLLQLRGADRWLHPSRPQALGNSDLSRLQDGVGASKDR